jgi:HD superfamily phosphohydrolase
MDRLDYLLRDSQATGVPYGHIDINYILNNLKVSPSGMVGISERAVPAAEQFLLARFFMHRTVYYHKTTFGMEEACRQLLRRLRDRGKYDIPKDSDAIKRLVTSDDLGTFTDAFVDGIIQKSVNDDNDVIRTLARSIQGRRPPKLLREIKVLRSMGDPNKHHAGTTFTMNCRHNLSQLAKDFDIPLERFILCETPPLLLEKHEEQELIKVFIGSEEEPKSLVDIPYSLISECTNLFFQSFRLYVVYEGSDKEEVIGRLKQKVRDWDKP